MMNWKFVKYGIEVIGFDHRWGIYKKKQINKKRWYFILSTALSILPY
jgi:hypothetical protein